MIDFKNSGPQLEAHGRVYRVTLDIFVPENCLASEEQLTQWLNFELLENGSIGDENPLSGVSVDGTEIVDVRDMKARVFTEWEPADPGGRRKGLRRVVPDGQTYNPVWAPPEPGGPLGFWAKCKGCAHCWIAANYPQELTAFAHVLSAARCPKCGGKPLVANQSNGMLQEVK